MAKFRSLVRATCLAIALSSCVYSVILMARLAVSRGDIDFFISGIPALISVYACLTNCILSLPLSISLII